MNGLFARGFLAFLLAAIVGFASAAQGPGFTEATPPASGEALVYLFRPSLPDATLAAADIHLGGRLIATLGPNDYTLIRVKPGHHLLSVTQPAGRRRGSYPDPLVLEAAAGKTYAVTLEAREEGHPSPDRTRMNTMAMGSGGLPTFARIIVGSNIVHRWKVEESPASAASAQQFSYRAAARVQN
jgi:hypothetical protein